MQKILNRIKQKIQFISRLIKRRLQEKFIILNYEKKREIILNYKLRYGSNIFIESGTFLGDTADFASRYFDKVYTIELENSLFQKAKARFKNFSSINVLEGDSDKILPEIINNFVGKALFWLDGHYSGEFYMGNEYIKTAKGEKESPILQELNSILTNGLQDKVILIDDARCFIGKNGYPSKKELFNLLNSFNIHRKQIKIKQDIIRITPDK
jgi:hypothetical protein